MVNMPSMFGRFIDLHTSSARAGQGTSKELYRLVLDMHWQLKNYFIQNANCVIFNKEFA